MTYQQIKDTIVEDKKLLDAKGLRKFVMKWALFVFGVALSLLLPTFSLLGVRFTIVIIVISALLFTQVLTLIVEDTSAFPKVKRLVSLWWIPYIVVVLVYFVLKFWNFM